MTGFILVGLLAATGAAEERPADRANRLLSQEHDVIDVLDALDLQIVRIGNAHREAGRDLAALEESRARLEVELAQVNVRLAAHRERLAKRIRVRHRLDDAGVMRILLDADAPTDFVRRRHYLREVLTADLKLLRDANADHTLRSALLKQQAETIAGLRKASGALDANYQALRTERAVRAEMLSVVRRERRLVERMLDGRKRARAALDEQVEAEPQGAPTGFEAERGQLPPPLAGRRLRGFGKHTDAALGTETFHKGIAIEARLGDRVRAVFAGRVVYAGWYKGFGNLVIVDHGDRYHTLYAHLSAISKARGEQVLQGAVVGEAGDAGSLRGPELYFELRQRGQPIDPARWLRR